MCSLGHSCLDMFYEIEERKSGLKEGLFFYRECSYQGTVDEGDPLYVGLNTSALDFFVSFCM